MDSDFLRRLLLAVEQHLSDGAKAWVYAEPEGLVLLMESGGHCMYVPLDAMESDESPDSVTRDLRGEFDEDRG